MDILDKIFAKKEVATKIVSRKAYTVQVNGRDLANRVVSKGKATKLAKRLRKAGYEAAPRLFGMVNLTEKELHRFA